MFDHDMLYDVERELLTKLSIKKEERKIFVDELVHSIKHKMTFFSSLINLIQRKCSFFARAFFSSSEQNENLLHQHHCYLSLMLKVD